MGVALEVVRPEHRFRRVIGVHPAYRTAGGGCADGVAVVEGWSDRRGHGHGAADHSVVDGIDEDVHIYVALVEICVGGFGVVMGALYRRAGKSDVDLPQVNIRVAPAGEGEPPIIIGSLIELGVPGRNMDGGRVRIDD